MAGTWIWTGANNLFSSDANLVGTMTVNKGTTPTDFAADKVLSVRIEVAITGSGISDDTWDTTRDYRIATAPTGSIGAAINGTDQVGLQNETDATDLTDSSPNTGLTIGDWEAMEVYGGDLDTEDIWAIYQANMMADGGLLQITGATQITITITYSVPVLITHTTDARIGTFVAHTMDAVLLEFDRPTDTNQSQGVGMKSVVDDTGKLWLLGTESGDNEPDIFRLWEGVGGPGIGNWVLHEFIALVDPNRAIHDMAITFVNGIIHILWIKVDWNTSIWWTWIMHLEFDPATNTFTDNGDMYRDGDSGTFSASDDSYVDVDKTSDDEMVVFAKLQKFDNASGDGAAFSAQWKLVRSASQVFVGETIHHYATDFLGAQGFQYKLALIANGTDVYAMRGVDTFEDRVYSHFDQSMNEGPRLSLDRLSPSIWYKQQALLGIDDEDPEEHEKFLVTNGRLYKVWGDSLDHTFAAVQSAAVGNDELVFDDDVMIDINYRFHWVHLFKDHYGRPGIWGILEDRNGVSVDSWTAAWLWNGIDEYILVDETDHGATLANNGFFVLAAQETIERTIPVWYTGAPGDWLWYGTELTTWYIAHTTDAVIVNSGKQQVYHTTDAVLVRGAWGRVTNSRQPHISESGSKFYFVFEAASRETLNIFESVNREDTGKWIASWSPADISGANGDERIRYWDYVEVSGVLHFIVKLWDTGRSEMRHLEYNIGTDTWTDNGTWQTSSTTVLQFASVGVNVRADGDIIAVYFMEDVDQWYYSINTGSGFPAGTAISGTTTYGNYQVRLAIDNNDTHIVFTFSGQPVRHWRLSPLDSLSSEQTGPSLVGNSSFWNSGQHGLVTNGIMYFPFVEDVGAVSFEPYVLEAATGGDTPTWSLTNVTAKDVEGRGSFAWFFIMPDGEPAWIFVETDTEDIYKILFDGTSWNVINTGYNLTDLVDLQDVGDFHSGVDLAITGSYGPDDIDAATKHYVGWWSREREAVRGEGVADFMWWPLNVNMNPTVFHKMDAHLQAREFLTHTTDAVLAVGSSPAITHDMDAVLTVKPTVEHTTDAVLVLIVSHTTDAVLAYDLATTISAEGNLVDTGTGLAIRQIPFEAKGQVQQGEHAPQFYQPTRRIFRK